MKEAAKKFSEVLKITAVQSLKKPISGPVPAGTVDPKMFKAKPVPQESIEAMGKQLDEYTEKKKDFSIW